MSGQIILIVEGQNDGDIATKIILCKYPHIKKPKVLKPRGNNPNLSRLAEQISELIATAKELRKHNDCIAVLHDADLMSHPDNREDYEKIQRHCAQHSVTHIEARDEIESWLLADAGFCAWIGINPANWDNRLRPSLEVERQLNSAHKPKYRLENIPQIVKHLDGSGDIRSESLRHALHHLENAPCIRE